MDDLRSLVRRTGILLALTALLGGGPVFGIAVQKESQGGKGAPTAQAAF